MLISSYTAQVTVHYRLHQMGKKKAQIIFFLCFTKTVLLSIIHFVQFHVGYACKYNHE